MESMNEDANTVKEPSKLVTYLVVSAKITVYIFLMLGFTGILAAVCIKTLSFFKISGILEEVVMQSAFLAGSFFGGLASAEKLGPPSACKFGIIPERAG